MALPGVLPFELSIVGRILGEARSLAGEPLYSVTICSLDGEPVESAEGYQIGVSGDLSTLRNANTVVVPPSHWRAGADAELVCMPTGVVDAETGAILTPPALREELRAAAQRGRVVSICNGAFVLASAGLLDGRTATTHWRGAELMQRLFPAVTVDPSVLFVDAGSVLTSAGAAAGIDLCLHLIRSDFGSAVANEVARNCVVSPHREGGQAQFVKRPVPEVSESSIGQVTTWALERLSEPLTVSALAARAHMSVRTFIRRFQEETGVSPAAWILRQRVDLALHLLETSVLPIEQVAQQAGFGTAAALRHNVHLTTGLSPLAYRKTFALSA